MFYRNMPQANGTQLRERLLRLRTRRPQDESDGHREAAYTSASQLAEAQQQVQHLQGELRQLHRDSSAAAQKAHETAGQVSRRP